MIGQLSSVEFQVRVQILLRSETFPAIGTFKRFLSRVYPLMDVQCTSNSKASTTIWTLIRPLSGVSPLMCEKIALPFKMFPTIWASEGGPFVDLHMGPQIFFPSEFFPTFCALIGCFHICSIFFAVESLVLCKSVFQFKGFSTLKAFIGSGFCMGSLMYMKVPLQSEPFPTIRAHVRLFSGMHSLMYTKLIVPFKTFSTLGTLIGFLARVNCLVPLQCF